LKCFDKKKTHTHTQKNHRLFRTANKYFLDQHNPSLDFA